MKQYKTTNEMTDGQMHKAYFGIVDRANQIGASVIANFGFGNAAPYILADLPDEKDPAIEFPDLSWELIEVQESQVVVEDVAEMGEPA